MLRIMLSTSTLLYMQKLACPMYKYRRKLYLSITMTAKLKHVIFPFTILSISLLFLITNYLFFTINYTRQTQDEFQNLASYLKRLRNHESFEVVSRETKDERIRDPKWFRVVAREFGGKRINIGLVNTDGMMMNEIHGNARMVKVHFNPVGKEILWSDMVPERIDEYSKCPDIPMPRFEDYQSLDVVVARLSRDNGCENGSIRDVFRLQVNLVVANLLARSGRKDHHPLFAVFVGSCQPMWEIFRCDDLVWDEGNTWIYKPDMEKIKQMVLMHVGACQFVPPFSHFGDQEAWRRHKNSQPAEAYTTVLHTSEDYVCGAIALAQSIIMSNSTKDLILLADENISGESIDTLRESGWKTIRIKRIRSPFSKKDAYNEWNYSKIRIWQLKQYQKLIFIDADFIMNRNSDSFFSYPQLTAAGNYQKHLFNSGLMVVEPSECTFRTLMKKMMVVESYNGGDQGFLNEMFPWWHRLPAEANYLKVFVDPKDHLHWVDKDVFAVHYTGLKPWKCFSDYDCNWDFPEYHRYASHSAQRLWRKVFRNMPKKLRDFCSPDRYKDKNGTAPVMAE